MPIDYRDYHPDWHSISRQIRDQADDRCEFCGVDNGAVGARDTVGVWHAENMIHGMNSDVGAALFDGEFPVMRTIVLTVAHLDHDIRNNDPCNLRALCQRCHLAWDRDHRLVTAALIRERKAQERVAASGQLGMTL